MSEATINIGINLIKVGVFVYDIVTYPLYAIVQQPWRAKGLMEKERVSLGRGGRKGCTWEGVSGGRRSGVVRDWGQGEGGRRRGEKGEEKREKKREEREKRDRLRLR